MITILRRVNKTTTKKYKLKLKGEFFGVINHHSRDIGRKSFSFFFSFYFSQLVTINTINLILLLLNYRETSMRRKVKLRRKFRILFVTVCQQVHYDKIDFSNFQDFCHLLVIMNTVKFKPRKSFLVQQTSLSKFGTISNIVRAW